MAADRFSSESPITTDIMGTKAKKDIDNFIFVELNCF